MKVLSEKHREEGCNILDKKNNFPTEVLTVKIEHFDHQGNGYAPYYHEANHKGNMGKKLNISVPGTLPGDVVKVTVPNAFGRRKAVIPYDELVQWSPDRTGQAESGQGQAGGSPLQYMAYSAQLKYKENKVKNYLEAEGFSKDLVQPIIGMTSPNHYRNKMELTFGTNGNIGMHEVGNFLSVIDWQASVIAPEIMIAIKNEISAWQKDWNLPSFDKETKGGLLRNLLIRQSKASDETMVGLFVTGDAEDYNQEVEDLVSRLTRKFLSIKSLLWLKNTNISDATHAEEEIVLFGRSYINEDLAGYKYRIWHDTFFQPNLTQAKRMVDIAIDFAKLIGTERVLDLFCGVGTFSLPLAAKSKELMGIELVESSIQSAKRNASDNGLANTHFIATNARHGLANLKETWRSPDVILLDPPRSGAGGKVMRAIGRLQADRIVYVSCNPKTLAEDLTWLADFGYKVKVVQPVDQFPHTLHVEAIALIQKM